MDLSERSLKSLWGRAGGRCSFPTCRMELFVEEEAPSPTLIGENCHIVAEKDNGPRGDPEMPISERNLYGNLILLCRNHHKVIDDNANGVGNYPIAKLLEIKLQHEVWVKGQLGYDANKQCSDEMWAGLIDDWQRLCHVDHWHGWSSYVLGSGQLRINSRLSDDLKEARLWLMTRVWPDYYPELKAAFRNFWKVLEDFHVQFLEHAEEQVKGTLFTRKFYRIEKWDEELYWRLGRQYDWHVDLVCDLMLELTRSANWICDTVRKTVDRSYRRKEGVLIVQRGPNSDLSFIDFPVHYSNKEIALETPYPGLDAFSTIRKNRDFVVGEGPRPQ